MTLYPGNLETEALIVSNSVIYLIYTRHVGRWKASQLFSRAFLFLVKDVLGRN